MLNFIKFLGSYKSILSIFFLLCLGCSNEELPNVTIMHNGPISWDEKGACTILYQKKNNEMSFPAKIKRRGGSSSKFWKHSYSLELLEGFQMGNLPKDDDWILNASYIDKTFMRHKISFDLYREMNERNVAAKCSYVTLDLNDKNMGIYVLMQKINRGLLSINKNDVSAMIFKDPPVFYAEKLPNVKDTLNYYSQKFPNMSDKDHTEYMENFRDLLFKSSDHEFAEKIDGFIDVDNVLDWHILLLFSNNSDGIMKNFYLYKRNASTPFRIAIWDYDHSFGRDGDNELNMMTNELDCKRSILLRRLMEIEETGYNQKLSDRWKDLRRQGVISEYNFIKHIDKNDKKIREVLDQNYERWPVNGKWYYDNNSYEQELDIMKDFVKLRIDQLDNYFR